MKRIWIPILVLLVAFALALSGPATPAADPSQPPANEDEPFGEPPGGPVGEPVESFEPSEKLPADSAVSFPVDI